MQDLNLVVAWWYIQSTETTCVVASLTILAATSCFIALLGLVSIQSLVKFVLTLKCSTTEMMWTECGGWHTLILLCLQLVHPDFDFR